MISIDGHNFENVSVVSLKRNVSIQSGSNTGTLLNGFKYFDTKASYISYTVVLNASTLAPSDYDNLFEILAQPDETHLVSMPWGQTNINGSAHISSVSDECLQRLSDHTLWGKLTITFSYVGAL